MSDVTFNRPIWETPEEAPAAYSCRRLSFPDSIEWRALINGALSTLLTPENWQETDGGLSIEDTIAVLAEIFLTTSENCPTGGGATMPIGAVIPFATSLVPSNYLICDGSQYARSSYPDLYDILAAEFIIDADNFVVPDLRDRMVKGTPSPGNVGTVGGAATHTLTEDEMPTHRHGIGNNLNAAGGGNRYQAADGTNRWSTYTGGSLPHNNLPPYMDLHWFIVAAED